MTMIIHADSSGSRTENSDSNTDAGSASMSKYSLQSKMIPFLDRQLAFHLVNDLPNSELVTKMKFELLRETLMYKVILNLESELNGGISPARAREYDAKMEAVHQNGEQLENQCSKIISLLADSDVVSNLRSDKVANLAFLKETHGVSIEMVDALYELGKHRYNTGDHLQAAEHLYQFRVLSTDNEKVSHATWGRLASEILLQEWDSVMAEILKVKDGIESRLFNSPLAQLHHRTWLIHWSLFPYFNYEPAREVLTEMFFSPAYINTIQISCPWILRYLAVAVITSRARTRNSSLYHRQIRDTVRVIQQEDYEYSDPVTNFLKALYTDFDFEEAQSCLRQAQNILQEDFFLEDITDDFVDAARHLISESYCKFHQRIDIRDLSERLGLSPNEGEKWIINLIRDTRLDGKIDYQHGTVVMNHPSPSVYQQILERTKGFLFRTQVLNSAVAK